MILKRLCRWMTGTAVACLVLAELLDRAEADS